MYGQSKWRGEFNTYWQCSLQLTTPHLSYRESLAAERLCDVLEVVFLHELKNSKVSADCVLV